MADPNVAPSLANKRRGARSYAPPSTAARTKPGKRPKGKPASQKAWEINRIKERAAARGHKAPSAATLEKVYNENQVRRATKESRPNPRATGAKAQRGKPAPTHTPNPQTARAPKSAADKRATRRPPMPPPGIAKKAAGIGSARSFAPGQGKRPANPGMAFSGGPRGRVSPSAPNAAGGPFSGGPRGRVSPLPRPGTPSSAGGGRTIGLGIATRPGGTRPTGTIPTPRPPVSSGGPGGIPSRMPTAPAPGTANLEKPLTVLNRKKPR